SGINSRLVTMTAAWTMRCRSTSSPVISRSSHTRLSLLCWDMAATVSRLTPARNQARARALASRSCSRRAREGALASRAPSGTFVGGRRVVGRRFAFPLRASRLAKFASQRQPWVLAWALLVHLARIVRQAYFRLVGVTPIQHQRAARRL